MDPVTGEEIYWVEFERRFVRDPQLHSRVESAMWHAEQICQYFALYVIYSYYMICDTIRLYSCYMWYYMCMYMCVCVGGAGRRIVNPMLWLVRKWLTAMKLTLLTKDSFLQLKLPFSTALVWSWCCFLLKLLHHFFLRRWWPWCSQCRWDLHSSTMEDNFWSPSSCPAWCSQWCWCCQWC